MERMFAAVNDAPDASTRPSRIFDFSMPLADAEAAWDVIVSQARRWRIDPTRIGMIGFSAGAGLTMQCALHSKKMRLAFIAPIYGAMDPVAVPPNAPPMFVAIAADDFLFRGRFGLIESWYRAGRPVEFHLYQDGGHGFGRGYPGHTTYWWFEAFSHWLEVNGFLSPSPNPAGATASPR
ncbi:MAG: hypothetical protein KatS3mg121_0261 [Gammaproteobacteria bacterium]|nr:MAG: hypothetical protein KatS3mg121_0261 [Gammaproteobacteria bacterium]